MSTANARAIVSRGSHRDVPWAIEDVELRQVEHGELVVRIVASGICHTDIVLGNDAKSIGGYPRIMGHEGAGYVEEIGPGVTVAKPGDPVLLSFTSCTQCLMCETNHPAHCVNSLQLNFVGSNSFYTSNHDAKSPIRGLFFGQSSFASKTIVRETSVVNAKSLIESEEELKMFAPLGCGILTGLGTIINAANAQPSDTIAIIGVGGVGLSAIMGAHIAASKTVIAIDRVASRLETARQLGATHLIDTSSMQDMDEIISKVKEYTGGYGTSITVDTTGILGLIERGLEFTRPKGLYIQLGVTPEDTNISIPLFRFMNTGKRFMGVIGGDTISREFIPKMIRWYRVGKLPLQKIVKFFPASDFAKALEEMHHGSTVKPIIVW